MKALEKLWAGVKKNLGCLEVFRGALEALWGVLEEFLGSLGVTPGALERFWGSWNLFRDPRSDFGVILRRLLSPKGVPWGTPTPIPGFVDEFWGSPGASISPFPPPETDVGDRGGHQIPRNHRGGTPQTWGAHGPPAGRHREDGALPDLCW